MAISKGLLFTGLVLELPLVSGMWIGVAAASTVIFGLLFVVSILRYRAQTDLDSADQPPGDAAGYGHDDGRYAQGDYMGEASMEDHQNMNMSGFEQDQGYRENPIGRQAMGQRASREAEGYNATMAVAQEAAPSPRQTLENDARPGGIYVSKVHNIGRRGSQQDSFGISQDGTRLDCSGKGVFAIVADGMGGLSNGGEVSALVTMSMMRSFDQQTPSADGGRELLSMLGKANDQVNDMLAPSGQGKSGSTVVSVLIRDMQLYWIAVGDSHIYLYRDGALMQINRDHVYSVDLDEMAARGEISVQEAVQDPQRKALTSYIGMGRLAKIDRNIRALQLNSGDRVLLMTDGVFGTLSDEEITAAMKLPVAESSQAMEQMILGKNKATQDNFTALILECV